MRGLRGEVRGRVVVVGRARPLHLCVYYVISHKSCRMPANVGPILSRLGHLCVLYISVSFIQSYAPIKKTGMEELAKVS